jgi:hypothetical protein
MYPTFNELQYLGIWDVQHYTHLSKQGESNQTRLNIRFTSFNNKD